MNKNLLESYKKIISEQLKISENKILEESLNNSFSINDLREILKKYLTRISKLEIDFEDLKNDFISNLNESNKIVKDVIEIKNELEKLRLDIEIENSDKIEESEKIFNEMKVIKADFDKKINFLNTFMIGILLVFFVYLLGLIYDIFFRYNDIKNDYINQTKELEKQIDLFKKEQEELKEDNVKLKENIKNEIEKEIYKTILQKS